MTKSDVFNKWQAKAKSMSGSDLRKAHSVAESLVSQHPSNIDCLTLLFLIELEISSR